MYKTILVPLDGSQCAEGILPHVEELAKRFESELILLRVVDHIPPLVTKSVAQLRKEDFEQGHKTAEAYLSAQAEELREKGLGVKTEILHGGAVNAIIQAAQDEDVDLIAMGSHGRSGLSQAFYGSVASGVLHRVDRPLLLIRPPSD
jgi:nucleotide-binding universal stress UspA family protein